MTVAIRSYLDAARLGLRDSERGQTARSLDEQSVSQKLPCMTVTDVNFKFQMKFEKTWRSYCCKYSMVQLANMYDLRSLSKNRKYAGPMVFIMLMCILSI